MLRGRSVCFTINNPNVEDQERLASANIKYMLYGTEHGENGTLHFQGFAYHKDAKLWQAWKTLLGPRSHVEFTKGNLTDAMAYCKKGEQSKQEWNLQKTSGPNFGLNATLVEIGQPPMDQATKGKGEQTRWDLALSAAKRGKFEDIDSQIQITQCRNLEHIHYKESLKTKHPYITTKHLWFHGASRTGKTLMARSAFPSAYLKNASNKWWDGYNNHDVVIMEDFDKAHVYNGYYLKIWADGYSFQAEKKGAHTGTIRPKLIIVTSNYKPSDIWNDEETLAPILNRFHTVEFTMEFTPIILWPLPIETPEQAEEDMVASQPELDLFPATPQHSFGSQNTTPLDYELTTEEEDWISDISNTMSELEDSPSEFEI